MKRNITIWFVTILLIAFAIISIIAVKKSRNTTEQICEKGNDFYEKKEYTKAFSLYYEAAKQGSAEAQKNIGVCYENGHGIKRNYTEAIQWYRKAAEQGNAVAQLYLGICYEEGRGVERNNAEAFIWYRKAAEQGEPEAQVCLGICYEFGRGIEKNSVKAVQWYRKAAEQGNANGQWALGFYYYNNALHSEAVPWIRKAAEQGHATAQLQLGTCYEYGDCVEQNYDIALQWFKRAAEQGNEYAFFKLGFMYENGEGVKQDYEKAIYWYQKEREQKKINAQRRRNQYSNEDEENDIVMSSQEKQALLEKKYKDFISNLDQETGEGLEKCIPKYIPTNTKRIYGYINNFLGLDVKSIIFCDSPNKELMFLAPPDILENSYLDLAMYHAYYKDYKVYNNRLYLIHYYAQASYYNMLSLYYVDLLDNSWHEIVEPGSCEDKTEFVGNRIKAGIHDDSCEEFYRVKWIELE